MHNRFLPIYKQYKSKSNLKSILDRLSSKEDNNIDTKELIKKIESVVALKAVNWFIGSTGVRIFEQEQKLQIDSSNLEGYTYISFLEKNNDLSRPPKLQVLSSGKYLVNFVGEKALNSKVELFLVYYKNNKRFRVKSILLNAYDVIEIDKNESIRLAIRVSGRGKNYIKDIQFFDLNNFETNSNKDVTNTNIDIKDYNWNLYKKIETFNFDDWFIKNNKKIKVSDIEEELHINSNFNDGEFAYISFKESNVDFSKKPNYQDSIISTDYLYKVSFKGEKQDTQRLELYLIFYSNDGKKIQLESILLNESRIIKLKETVKFVRIAIRTSGIGKSTIKNIIIERKKDLESIPFNKLRKIGYNQIQNLKELKVAAICDEFTMQCLMPEVKLVTFGPDDWKAIFEFERPNILFVESAWHGNGGRWTRKVSHINQTNTLQLQELVKWCRDHDIPTVFWNKEDPVHFNSFIKTAQYFDFIFTTDEDSIPNYIENVNHSNVFPLPFAAQPFLHNPIEVYERKNKACFAGSYYADKYLERQRDMNLLLEYAGKYGLEIYDRNYGKDNISFYFPENLKEFIVGKLQPHEIAKAYKGYKIALNVNSVIDSPTMFSRRVFECLACNTPVISTYSRGIENVLGNTVFMSKEEKELDAIFKSLYEEEEVYEQIAHLGYRKVMTYHTYEERLRFLLSKLGYNFSDQPPKIEVLSYVKNKSEVEKLFNMFNQQIYKNKQLTILVEDIRLIKNLGNLVKNNSVEFITIEEFMSRERFKNETIISYFKPGNYYGENYLSDLVLAYKYSKSDIIGKASFYEYSNGEITLRTNGKIHSYVSNLNFESSVIKVSPNFVLTNEQIFDLIKGNKLDKLLKVGYRLYSSDKYNFVRNYKIKEKDLNQLEKRIFI